MRSIWNCRSARSRRPIIHARSAPPRSCPWRDGYRILWTVLKLYRAERPLSLFGAFGLALAIMSIGLAIPVFVTFVQEGLVPRLPTAVLSTGLMLLAFLSIAVGLILDTVTRGRRELKLLAYLGLRAPGEERRRS